MVSGALIFRRNSFRDMRIVIWIYDDQSAVLAYELGKMFSLEARVTEIGDTESSETT